MRRCLQDSNESDTQAESDEGKSDSKTLNRWQESVTRDVVRLLARIWLRRVADMAAYPAETAEEAAEAPPVAALPTL